MTIRPYQRKTVNSESDFLADNQYSQVTLRPPSWSPCHLTSFGVIVGGICERHQSNHLYVKARDSRASTLKVSTFLCIVSWLTHSIHLQLSLWEKCCQSKCTRQVISLRPTEAIDPAGNSFCYGDLIRPKCLG